MLARSVLLLALLLTGPAIADVRIGALSDGDLVVLRMTWPTENLGRWGLSGSWHESAPKDLWGLGIVGVYDVMPDAQFPLRKLLPKIGDWLNLPETVAGTVYLKLDVGAVALPEKAQAEFSPGAGLRIGPLCIELAYRITEAGGIPDDWESGLIATFGAAIRF